MSKSLRDWVYWPSRLEYAAPWLIGPALFIVLGALGFSARYIETAAHVRREAASSIALTVLGTALNFILLLTYARTAYVTPRQAARPVAGTLVLLSVVYGALWSALLMLDGALTCALCAGDPVDAKTTLHVAATAVQILASVLLVSAFWKTEELGLGKLQKIRDVANGLLPDVVEGKASLEEYTRLVKVLEEFPAAAAEVGLVSARQQSLIQSWTEAAEKLAEDLAGYHPGEIPENIPTRVAANVLRLARS